MSSRLNLLTQQRRQDLQRCRQNIGQHGLISTGRQIWQARIQADFIGLGIEVCGSNGRFINVNSINAFGTKFGGANGKDARATAIV